MTQFEVKFLKTISAVERYYTVTEASHQRVVARVMEWTENYPRKVNITLDNKDTTTTENLLNSAFAGWDSGTGALELGDRLEYSVYPESDLTTKTRVFYGIVTDLSQNSAGRLTVTARDYLEKYEYLQPNRIFFHHYRDEYQKAWTQGTGAVSIDTITETGIVWPPVSVKFAWTDYRRTLSGTGPYITDGVIWDDIQHWLVAQPFRAEGDGLIGIQCYYQTSNVGTDGPIYCQIRTDNNGVPSDTVLEDASFDVGLGSQVNTPHQINFADSGHDYKTVPLKPGQKYWAVFYTELTDADAIYMVYHTTPSSSEYKRFYYKSEGGSWTATGADEELTLRFDFTTYDDVASESFYFDGTNKIIVKQDTAITTVDSYYGTTVLRGKVSYYYDTVTSEEIFDWLIAFDTSFTGSTNLNLDTTYSLYQTRGKSIGECFRDFADMFETTGAYSGSQRIVAHYEDSGTHYVKVGFKDTSTTALTIGHGADTATDDEVRVVSVDLKKTTSMRSATAIVHGTGPNGEPIIVERDDRAATSSFRSKTGMHLTMTLTDESISSISAADAKAWQMIDATTKDAWEGTITIAGVYPDLFELTTSDISYGSGLNVVFTYSPLGISAVTFHVKGIVLHENTTEIQVSNQDLLMLNALTDARGKAERSEAFLAPDNQYEVIFISGYSPTVVTDTSLYMELDNAEDTPITGLERMLCTKFTNSRYNLVTYHAEFEMGNGWTTDGGTPVNRLELYDAKTGGSWHATGSVSGSDQFHKWRKTKVIAEVHTKAS